MMKTLFYPAVGFGVTSMYFSKIMNIEVCEILTKLDLH
jgi:hypothetical protein